MAFKLGLPASTLMHDMYAYFDDLDLDARSQWLGRGHNSALNYLDN